VIPVTGPATCARVWCVSADTPKPGHGLTCVGDATDIAAHLEDHVIVDAVPPTVAGYPFGTVDLYNDAVRAMGSGELPESLLDPALPRRLIRATSMPDVEQNMVLLEDGLEEDFARFVNSARVARETKRRGKLSFLMARDAVVRVNGKHLSGAEVEEKYLQQLRHEHRVETAHRA